MSSANVTHQGQPPSAVGQARGAASLSDRPGDVEAEASALVERYGRPFAQGEVFFRQGDPADGAFLVHSGRVRLLKRIRAVEQSLVVLKAGDLFGEGALAEGGPRTTTAIALSDGIVVAVDAAGLRHISRTFPDTSERIVRQLIGRLHRAEDQAELLMLRDATTRVVRALLKMAKDEGNAAELPLSPVDLSSRVGLDVETVKGVVQKLRRQNYVRLNGEQLELPDVDALRKLFSLLSAKGDLAFDR